jgi:hypothetical protein
MVEMFSVSAECKDAVVLRKIMQCTNCEQNDGVGVSHANDPTAAGNPLSADADVSSVITVRNECM